MIIKIDDMKVFRHWKKEKIEEIAAEKEMSQLEAIVYLWFYNYVSISEVDRSKDSGRRMYIKFAKCFGELIRGLGDYVWK